MESYELGLGSDSAGLSARLYDREFGGGSARCLVRFVSRGSRQGVDLTTGKVRIKVHRSVPRGKSVLPLDVTGVQLIGYDINDAEIVNTTDTGFRFKRSGREELTFDKLPREVVTIQVIFTGAYVSGT